ncbi:MAG TPA: chromate transporter [Clostridiales bacterium]|nr:chromate transporter [Clostridiales bacterium]
MKKTSFKYLLEIFALFFKIGSFTFGGGFAMIPMIEKEVIEKKGWVKKEELMDIFAVSQTVPGAIAINTATCIGVKLAGRIGAVFATAGIILPSLIIITLIASLFTTLEAGPVINAAMEGIQPVVVALIVTAAVRMWKTTINDVVGVLIAIVTVVLITVFDVSAIVMILLGALTGMVINRFFPDKAKKIVKKELSE